MKNTNGHGIYKREIEEPPSRNLCSPVIPDIKEIRAIIHNGETYLNAKDVSMMMKKCSYSFNSISVCNFVKRFVLNLIG